MLLAPIHTCVEVDSERVSAALKSRGADPAEWDEAIVTQGVEHVARLLTPHLRLAVSVFQSKTEYKLRAVRAARKLDVHTPKSSVSQGAALDTCILRFVV